MKIAILGAGAMGSAIGALLAKAGNDVTLIDVWKEAVEAINRDGLKIQDKAGEIATHTIRAVVSPAQVAGPVDLLLVFVKCYHTVDAVRSALPILGPDSTVLSLQNGWGNGPRIAEVVGQERVVLGVCYHSATVLGPGHVLHAGRGKTYIGEMGSAVTPRVLNLHAGRGTTYIGEMDGAVTPRMLKIAEKFQAAGLNTEASGQVLKEIWSKLALNVATLPTSSTIKLTAEKLPNTPEMQSLMRALLLEVVSVAQLQGIALDFTERWNTITGLLGNLAPNTKGSMLQDVENRRRTEIDVMCGAIIEAGARLGFATPYNNAMLWLVKALEANYQKGN